MKSESIFLNVNKMKQIFQLIRYNDLKLIRHNKLIGISKSMRLDELASQQSSRQQTTGNLSKLNIADQSSQNILTKSQLLNPKPSILNFFIFVIFIFTFGLFHYRPNNQRLLPIIPQYFQNQIFAGQVHYSRIPAEYWEHRIMMIKAMGLNTLSVYVMWNFHEVERGVFDYQTGNKNLTHFIQICAKHQMKILFRPGPYVCAEWDLGGFPARLLSIANLTLRSSEKQYMQQVSIYFSSLAPIIRPYIRNPYQTSTFDNPIIMLQIQNEYGFYGTDKSYILSLRRMWRQLGIHCEEYYVDWIENIKSSYWENANIGINNGYPNNGYHMVSAINKNGMIFGGQIYSGWYKKWGESTDHVSTLDNFIYMYDELLKNHHSFSVYLVHGGTNFGLTAGANYVYNSQTDFAGVITSYDYESPITQNGNITEKYLKFRQLIQKYLAYELPPIPSPVPNMKTEQFTFGKSSSLINCVKNSQIPVIEKDIKKFQSEKLKMFNQGAVLYQKNLLPFKNYQVQIQAHDFALIFVNHALYHIANRSASTQQTFSINCGQSDTCLVEIFVQSMGHINFGVKMQTDFKGLIEFKILQQNSSVTEKLIPQNSESDWKMFSINLQIEPIISNEQKQCQSPPCIFQMTINLIETSDTFIDLSKYQKGYVWVNGHNLGRYWNVGPQYRLYCPGVWLKKGKNIIIVLDLLLTKFQQIEGKLAAY